MPAIETGALEGRLVRLEPLRPDHAQGLGAAAGEDRSSYGFASVPSGEEGVRQYVGQLLDAAAAGEAVPFAQVRTADGRVVGATRVLNIRRRPEGGVFAIEIGGTWLAASAQRSGTNTEAKLLLMELAFESLGAVRVDIKTDARNAKARRAIEALGTTFEGVLRQWQPSQVPGEETLLRDTAMYSVLATEWPQARARLRDRLTTFA